MYTNFFKKMSLYVGIVFCFFGFCEPAFSVKPNIIILGTGGTISGEAKSPVAQTYGHASRSIQTLTNAVPDLLNLANVSTEQIAQVDSRDMTTDVWLKISKKTNQLLSSNNVDGIVITHGTDSLEETAYFLDLVIKSKKPVVIVGSMRPANGISTDGALNLFNAVAVAASPKARDKGVLVVLNDTICDARDATKTNTTNVDTFKAPNGGMLGYVHNGRVTFYHSPLRKNTWQTEFDVANLTTLPRVGIIYSHIGEDPSTVKSMTVNGIRAIVLAGFGSGHVSKPVLNVLKEAISKGIVVVRSSRTGSGQVGLGESELDDANMLVADDLNPQKARILLALALTKTNDTKQIQSMFFKY